MGKDKELEQGNVITVSLVLYLNNIEEITTVIKSTLSSGSVHKMFLIDNSPSEELGVLKNIDCEIIEYCFQNKNLGFGAAHNIAFNLAYKLNSTYHIIVNPDISFKDNVIPELAKKMDIDNGIGVLMPKIVYPTGGNQYLCKLLPEPKDLIFRRFVRNEKVLEKMKIKYELRFFSYNEEAEIPVLSGCFMMIRTSLLKQIKGFDERFFMYLEDVDLTRRIGELSKTVYYPNVEVIHTYEKGSYKNKKLFGYHVKSAIMYFNKWGWFFDKKRRMINRNTLEKLNYKKA
jgi:GT2 family glycosyltransferase